MGTEGMTEKTMHEKNPKSNYLATESNETEIDLGELLLRFLEHIRFLIVLAFLGAAVSAIYTFYFVTPLYEATSKLYIVNSTDSAINLSDLQIGTYLASDYIEVFKTWEVHEEVIQNLGLNYSYSQLQDMLTIENPSDTRILNITVLSPKAQEAADIANEYANVAIKYIAGTMSTEEPNVMSVALVPTNTASPNLTKNILIGFFFGFALAAAIVTVRFVTDDKIKSMDDVQRYTGQAVLAIVPTLTFVDKKIGKVNSATKR